MSMFWRLSKKKKEAPVEVIHASAPKRGRLGIKTTPAPPMGITSVTSLRSPSKVDSLRREHDLLVKKNQHILSQQNMQAPPTSSLKSQPNQGTPGVQDNQLTKPSITNNNQQDASLRRPISELAARFRPIFEPYMCFNRVQSMVFDTIFQTDDPIIVSAPTGSGKTGIFELAIIKMIQNIEQRLVNTGPAKVVYLAPTKALCTERRIDWQKKFKPFNIDCIELTSDISQPVNYRSLTQTKILLATPEKWDSVTRSWNSHKAFIQSVRLLLIDEVHLINDGHRGATLEAVLSRMKIIRSVIWPSEENSLRFIAVSATITNIQDIADWFSSSKSKAQVFKVEAQERPVKLKTVVLGYSCTSNMNDFQFDALLNHKICDVLKDYSNGKPSLIFCTTRKSTVTAAQVICREGKFDNCFSNDRRRDYLTISRQLKDKVLQETTRFGVAFHHAGLTVQDRRLIEEYFLAGKLPFLCCTSTLAVGVNLPAHLVVIKNTYQFDEGKFKPYPESSLIQMMGRAGRPQFDTEATAVIMTKSSCREDIEKMLTGKLIVDSHLHKHLIQHLNSEIVLGTVTNEVIARNWIDSTYLHVRLMKNPENYGLKPNSSKAETEATIIKWCEHAIQMLLKHGMIVRTNQCQLEPTDAGKAMAKHYISVETMIKLVTLTGDETLLTLLQLITSTNEVIGDVQLRTEDRSCLSAINNPVDDRHKLKFVMDKIDTREKKAITLIQAVFGNLSIPENSLFHESLRILKNASRVVSCLKDLCIVKNNIGYRLLSNVLTLAQCFEARLWYDSIYVSKQIEKIGPILSHNLAQNGLTSFESLRKANPRNIEIFCSRLAPFGSKVQQTCFGLPHYGIRITFNQVTNQPSRMQILVEVTLLNGQDLRSNITVRSHSTTLIVGALGSNKLLLRQEIEDNAILMRPDLTVCFGEQFDRKDIGINDEVEARLISDNYVGLDAMTKVKYTEVDS